MRRETAAVCLHGTCVRERHPSPRRARSRFSSRFFQGALSPLQPLLRVFPPDCSSRPPAVSERAPVCRVDRGQIVPGWLSGAYTDTHKHPESHWPPHTRQPPSVRPSLLRSECVRGCVCASLGLIHFFYSLKPLTSFGLAWNRSVPTFTNWWAKVLERSRRRTAGWSVRVTHLIGGKQFFDIICY